ncbi:GNAT family N-acetyltransferase [Streptomyces griseocarneus]|uniref:GNAT family N-acetyltransferase n=1 Tax=Streptomyces griseocarneus TaxID=51201 RepID=UPI0019AC14A8|nr:GNAT family N-acetyltransferase [Streptomyces griseocarneus]MBZ6473962.1 GNAT family N-acetyltransferase [Streptomyces griseocarneus]GHG66129.1 acetyltransferase [Streptomyces griseocarneus]
MREVVEASGLVLRRWGVGDAPAVLEAYAEPLMRWQAPQAVESDDDARQWVRARVAQWEEGTAFSFAVVEGEGDGKGTVLGNVAVSAVDRRHDTGWVSYWTTRSARGRGVAGRACRGVARWAFDDLGLFRLELGHRVNNPASCRVATAAGFAVEGIQRQKLLYDGVRYDVESHARLATDAEPPTP